MFSPLKADSETIELSVSDGGGLDVSAALDLSVKWGCAGELARGTETLIGLSEEEIAALLDQLRALDSNAPCEIMLGQQELLGIQLAMSLALDGPFDEPLAAAGDDETRWRRAITGLHSILQVWLSGRLREATASPPFHEGQILPIARSVAANKRDPLPILIQHSLGGRQQANLVMTDGGHVVSADEPSYLVGIQGNFSAPTPTGPLHPPGPIKNWAVQMIVLDATTGQITDSGGSDHCPDLTALGPVTTDRSSEPPSLQPN